VKPGLILLENYEQLKKDLADLEKKYEVLEKKYEHAKRIIQTMSQAEFEFQGIPEFPKNFEGFTLRRDGKGYIRGYKRIRGKIRAVYIGREFRESLVKQKIAKYSD
jgi:hypothetical protein